MIWNWFEGEQESAGLVWGCDERRNGRGIGNIPTPNSVRDFESPKDTKGLGRCDKESLKRLESPSIFLSLSSLHE